MKIGIDGYEANVEKRVGVGQYAFQLLRQFHRLDKENDYLIYLPHPPLEDLPKADSHWRYIIGKSGRLWTLRELPKLIAHTKPHLIFSPTHYSPFTVKIPKIVAVMDLSYIYFPQMFRPIDLIKLRYLGGWSIKRADHIMTISHHSKKKISEYYKLKLDKITVTYPGGDTKAKAFDLALDKKAYLGEKYILFVGTIQPRKNISRLIQAFEKLTEPDLKLLLVGKKGWQYGAIFQTWEKSPMKDEIKFLDFVSDEELSALYKHAVCLVLPSLYEGFGIPVLEAMRQGCPVVVVNNTSLPEIAGDLGIYVDPMSITSIAQGLRQAVQLDQNQRVKLSKKLIARAKEFTWEKCAKDTLKVFQKFK